ncbi:hypothetical protein AB0M02_27250 [Actinoplanes sp. NPDC051861]|uniref:hypothetical protein n=1 Tax=Actinoplanes sp. NPDC051861 TaxID=3155170 RepID=UPI0034244F3F
MIARLALALFGAPAAVRRARANAVHAMATFDRTARPMIGDVALASALAPWSVKGAHLIAAWCKLAGLPFPAGTAVLGCCFARIYDDVLDARGTDPAVGERFTLLLGGGPFVARSSLERVLSSLYSELSTRLGGDRTHPVRLALVELHRYQLLSRPGTSAATLHERTMRKGGLSLFVLFSLAEREMAAADRDLVFDLGGCLQMIDDYQDRDADRRVGIPTLATVGSLRWSAILRRLRSIERAATGRYGRAATREFFTDIYLFLIVARIGRIWRRGLRPPRSPLGVLVVRGGSVLPG